MSDKTAENKYEIKCNKCAKTLGVKRTEGVTKMTLKINALKAGWAWVDKDTHLCSDHKPAKVKKEASPKEKKEKKALGSGKVKFGAKKTEETKKSNKAKAREVLEKITMPADPA